jgi:hypothetical protein
LKLINPQELIDDVVEDLRSSGYHLLADAFKDENTRDDAVRVLQAMLRDLESPD